MAAPLAPHHSVLFSKAQSCIISRDSYSILDPVNRVSRIGNSYILEHKHNSEEISQLPRYQ